MGMFSEELAILDRNTVKYMLDEMQNEIDEQKHTIESLQQKYKEDLAESMKNTIDILRSLDLPEE